MLSQELVEQLSGRLATYGAMARKPPWRRHGPPSPKTPLEKRSLEELEALIARGREPSGRMQQLKRVRRNKWGGKRSGQVRGVAADERAAAIRAKAAAFSAAGEKRFVPELMRAFGVSRSTIMRVLRGAKVCHEPNLGVRMAERAKRRKS